MKKFQINPKVLEEEIDAEKLAIADAKHNIPPSDSKTPGASESKIRMNSIESLMETVSKINKSGSYLQRKLAETKIKNEKRLDDTKTAPERFKKEASIIVEKNLNRLNRASKNLVKSEIELREFQAEYKLENVAAIYPDSLLLYVALIVGGLLLESIINATVFSEYLNRGLIQGLGWAFGYAFVNIIVSWFFGYFAFRQLWSVSVLWKIIGVISTIIWLCFLLGWNLIVATIRANFENFINKEIKSLDTFVYSVDLSDPASILLISIGITFGAIVFVEGFRNDDKHPGYGRKHRNVEKFSDLVEAIEIRKDKKLKRLLESYNNLLKKDEMFIQSGTKFNLKNHQMRTKLINDFKNDIEQKKLKVEYLIKKYREKNTVERTDPPPKYFSQAISPLKINYEKFKDIKLEDYQIGEKDIFNKIKLKITDEYNKISQSVNKKSNAK